jgi:hypothetical protein
VTQSSEYPDLRFVPPRAYGTGRDGKAVRYIVIHYTAGAERSTSAEDGAANDQHRTDGTSTHYFVDSDSVVQCVLTSNRGNAARAKGNRLGIQYELCGTAQTRAQWLDAASLPTLRNAAKQVARDCRKYDIPVRRLSVVETRRAWTEFPEGRGASSGTSTARMRIRRTAATTPTQARVPLGRVPGHGPGRDGGRHDQGRVPELADG